MALLSTPAIVLGGIKLGEADKLVTFYTVERGKLKGVARGARRMKSRFGASLEPFTHCNLVLFEKGSEKLARINQSDIVHSFQNLRENWEEIHSSLLLVQLVQRLTLEGQPNPSIYRLLLEGLTFLEHGVDRQLSIILFVTRLIAYSGYQPRWDRCLRCSKPSKQPARLNSGSWSTLYFSAPSGGALCMACARGMGSLPSISPGALAFLDASRKMDYSRAHRLKPSPAMRKEIETLFRNHLAHITGTPFPKFPVNPRHNQGSGIGGQGSGKQTVQFT